MQGLALAKALNDYFEKEEEEEEEEEVLDAQQVQKELARNRFFCKRSQKSSILWLYMVNVKH
jgi:DNA-directed RNA polymerase subunit N (RpoN/RPB10)